MIMDIGNGKREIAHIKQRYDVNGVKIKQKADNMFGEDITDLTYSIRDKGFSMIIAVWRLFCEPGKYNFCVYLTKWYGEYEYIGLNDVVCGDDLDAAMISTIKVYEALVGAMNEKRLLLPGLS